MRTWYQSKLVFSVKIPNSEPHAGCASTCITFCDSASLYTSDGVFTVSSPQRFAADTTFQWVRQRFREIWNGEPFFDDFSVVCACRPRLRQYGRARDPAARL